jgi:Transcriptional regulator
MYNYPQYKEKDREKIIAFMRQYPFVMLVGCDRNQRMVCTQIPVLGEEKEGELVITGHMAKKSDHETAFRENPRALMVFTGPHTYVSGTWYAGNPQQASTWNYIAIHARGELKWMEEAAWSNYSAGYPFILKTTTRDLLPSMITCHRRIKTNW